MASEFEPIGAYGPIGNDDRCALVSRNGSIDWCCLPHVESPSVFAAILDPDVGGRFAVHPADEFDASRAYVDRTNVLRTTFETDAGTAALTDFMPVSAGSSRYEGFQRSLYRKLEVEEGPIAFDATFEPRFDYARASTAVTRRGEDEIVASGGGDSLHLHVRGDADPDVAVESNRATASVTLDDNQACWLFAQHGRSNRFDAAAGEDLLAETIEYWREWLADCESSADAVFEVDDEWRASLVRSTLVLKLLVHEGFGSIPAAPTTSLPEELGGALNWDYRYNWIRDAKFTVQALFDVGQDGGPRLLRVVPERGPRGTGGDSSRLRTPRGD